MSDLTEQLRRICRNVHRGNIIGIKEIQDATWKAADEIERLTAEVEALHRILYEPIPKDHFTPRWEEQS